MVCSTLISPPLLSPLSGAGKMAEAMIAPLMKGASPPLISFYEISPSITKSIIKQFPHAQPLDTMEEAAINSDVVVIAVKPQNAKTVYKALHPILSDHSDSSPNPVVLSIMAGVPIGQMVDGLGTPKVVRSMPNTPAMIEQGVTVWTVNKNMPTDKKTSADSFAEEELALARLCFASMVRNTSLFFFFIFYFFSPTFSLFFRGRRFLLRTRTS